MTEEKRRPGRPRTRPLGPKPPPKKTGPKPTVHADKAFAMRAPSDWIDALHAAASAAGETVSEYARKAVAERIERERK